MRLRNVGVMMRVWAVLCAGMAAACLVTSLCSICFAEWPMLADFLGAALLCIMLSAGCWLGGRSMGRSINSRDAILIVASGWVLVSMLGSLPFLISGALGPVDALFESVSGFTTTGSSVMSDLDAAPRSLAVWRSVTHWLGGMGIILLVIAVLPQLGVGGKLLLLRESTGPTPKGIEPKAQETAERLFLIYIALTVVGILLYMLVGLNLYEAINHAFSAISTGGFSTRFDSIASFNSLPVELVTIIVMLAGGVNFLMYYKLSTREWRGPLCDFEMRVYFGIFFVGTVLVTANLTGMHWPGQPMISADGSIAEAMPFSHALRVASFEVATMMTDCGFVLTNYDEWPLFSQLMLFLVTMIGGSVGSTAGGLKILRLIVIVHVLYNMLERACRPKLVKAVRVNSMIMDADIISRVMFFLALYMGWMIFGIFFMSFTGLPLDAAVTSVIATMNNCGPGLGVVGPTSDFSGLHTAAKLFLCLNMLVGRLELVTFLVMLLPSFWRND